MREKLLCMSLVLGFIASTTNVKAQRVFALTKTNQLYWFDAANPATKSSPVSVTGLGVNQQIVGMDIRPATGELYILGYNATMQTAQVYVVDTMTKNALAIGAGINGLTLNGEVGFDFNPTVDRIRVVSSGKQDYRLHPVTGALVATDGMIAYAGTDVNAGINPNIGSAAYTNSYIGSTATTLYNYDDSLNVFTIQNPPNNGIQNTVGMSGLMVNMNDRSTDLDIYFNPVTGQNMAFLVANTGMQTNDSLYSVNLTTGMATPLAALGMEVKDIAVMIERPMMMPSGNLVYALTSTSNLVSFYSGNPQQLLQAIPVTGLGAGQQLVGLDVRPEDLGLYGLGYNASTMVARIYRINKSTAVATPVSTDSIVNIDLTGRVGFDFNPTVDRIRVVTSNGKNYRLNPITGTIAATDLDLKFAASDVNAAVRPNISAVAYVNSRANATTTTLYTYDDSLNIIATQTPPNDGVQNTIASSGIMVSMVDRTVDMDIYFDHLSLSDKAYLAANTSGVNDKLYNLNLTTGMVMEIGTIGMGISVLDIAVQLDSAMPVAASSQLIMALTNANELVTFNASNPMATLSAPMAITGVSAGFDIVGMDVRPATGELYILAYNQATLMAQLYKVDTLSKMATAIGTGINNLMLTGKVGFDFNPSVDRIRVVSSNNHDYRLHPVTGALVATDGNLAYASTDVNAGKKANVGTAAYTNSYIGASSTILYNYDDSLNVLTTQNPPNSGIQNTVGSSGIMVNLNDATSDMDIYFNPTTMQNMAYFIANPASATHDILYMMNLATGKLSFIGNIGIALKDIAVPVNRMAPMPSGQLVYALSANNNIVSFRSANPQYILSQVAVSGLDAGQILLGFDVRPTDLKLYGLGYNAATGTARVYTINPGSGVATPVTMDSIVNIDLSGDVAIDFNPVADRMRVVTSKRKSYRINQLTGLLVAQDSSLSYKTGDVNFGITPTVSSVAYTGTKAGATATVLYAYDDSLNMLLTQNPPNEGLLNTVGTSGIMMNLMDKTSDMDIYFNHQTQADMAYLTANTTGNSDKLYSLNLATGMATEVGSIGLGIAIRDIAIQLDSTPTTTGLAKNEIRESITVSAYPNPMTDRLTILFEQPLNGEVTVEMIDITGKRMDAVEMNTNNAGSSHIELNTGLLTKGVYFIRLQMNGISTTLKVVK